MPLHDSESLLPLVPEFEGRFTSTQGVPVPATSHLADVQAEALPIHFALTTMRHVDPAAMRLRVRGYKKWSRPAHYLPGPFRFRHVI